ncbi:MAG: IS200/IS605 family transposase [Terriglobales bacterium]
MKHTRVSLRVHCIFSTKDRRPAIPEELQSRTWAFIGAIARNLGLKAIAVGGMADHAHILLLLAPTMPLAEAVQKIKANSSRWLREQTGKPFQWQEGYAAFSVSISHTDATVAYILNQRKHHARRSFDQELAAILKKHRMEE